MNINGSLKFISKKASPYLINLEDRPEKEVQEIHDRFGERTKKRMTLARLTI